MSAPRASKHQHVSAAVTPAEMQTNRRLCLRNKAKGPKPSSNITSRARARGQGRSSPNRPRRCRPARSRAPLLLALPLLDGVARTSTRRAVRDLVRDGWSHAQVPRSRGRITSVGPSLRLSSCSTDGSVCYGSIHRSRFGDIFPVVSGSSRWCVSGVNARSDGVAAARTRAVLPE